MGGEGDRVQSNCECATCWMGLLCGTEGSGRAGGGWRWKKTTHKHSANEHVIAALCMSVRVSVYVALGLNRFNCKRVFNQRGAVREGGRAQICGTGHSIFFLKDFFSFFKRMHHEERTHLFHGLQGQSTFLQPETAFSLHQALAFDGRRTCAQARHYFDGNA